MKQFLLVLLVSFGITSTSAQKCKIKGVVTDQNHAAVSYCNVVLKTLPDSTFVTGCTTDDNGAWELSAPAGKYCVLISFIGYNPYSASIILKQDTNLGSIGLKESTVQLKELVVTGKRQVRTAQADIYYLSDSPKTYGRNALEVVTLAAGVSLDRKKGLKIYGKEGVRVELNGRSLIMEGKELTNYLANLRGEDIASIEVSSLADASQTADTKGGVIRIKMKQRALNGYDMSVGMKGTSYGTTFLGVKPDVSFNARINKLNLYGNLSFNSVGWRENDSDGTEYRGENKGVNIYTSPTYKSTNSEWFCRLGGIYNIDDKHTLGLDIDGTTWRYKESTNTPSELDNKGVHSNYLSNYYSPDSLSQINVAFNFIRKVSEKGSSLIIDAAYLYSKEKYSEDNYLHSTDVTPAIESKTFDLSQNTNRMATGGLKYKWVVTPALILETGAKFNHTKFVSNIHTNKMESGKWVLDTENTDEYTYREDIWAGYINGTYNLSKWNLMAGLRYELTSRDMTSKYFSSRTAKNNYNNFYPVLSAVYNIDKDKGHSLTLKYRYSITRPDFSSLVPFSAKQNIFTNLIGNPLLKPSYSYSAGIDLLLFHAFYFGLDYTKKKDAVELTILPREKNSLFINVQFNNIPQTESYMAMAYIPIPVTKWFYASLEMSGARKSRQFESIKDHLWQFYGNLQSNITFAKNWDLEVNANYVNREFYGNMILKNYYKVDLSLKRSFMKKKLQVAFNAINIFNRRRELVIDDESINRTLFRGKSADCKNFSLSVRYLFGSKTKVNGDRIKSINAEERARAKGNSDTTE